jgi:hypothetical protein
MSDIPAIMERARAFASQDGMSAAALARLAGLSVSTLRPMFSDTWNPLTTTLLALQAVLPPVPHPDAELLTLCARLAEQQATWQALWVATPDKPNGGPEDVAFDTFSSFTWPGTRIADPALDSAPVTDLPALLLTLPATTPEGLQAKAAAVLAISDANMFTGDCRMDEIELLRSVVIDAVGSARRLVGEDHATMACRNFPLGSRIAANAGTDG